MKPPRMLDIEEMWKESGLRAAKDITVPLINYLTGAVMCLSELDFNSCHRSLDNVPEVVRQFPLDKLMAIRNCMLASYI